MDLNDIIQWNDYVEFLKNPTQEEKIPYFDT